MLDDRETNEFENGYHEAGDIYRVITALSAKERLSVIPLVCKLWRDLMQSPFYWLCVDFDGFSCRGGWLQRRMKLSLLASGFISILSDYGSYVLSIDMGNERVPLGNQVSVCRHNAFLKAILRLCPNITSLKISGKAVTSAVLETVGRRQHLKKLYISETARGKLAPTEGFLKLLRRCPNLEHLSFPFQLLRSPKTDSKALQWIRTSRSKGLLYFKNTAHEAGNCNRSNLLNCKIPNTILQKHEDNHSGGIWYDALRFLGEWFPELTEFITPNLLLGKTVKKISEFPRLKTLSINIATTVWIQGEPKNEMQSRASDCFSQILDSCRNLENLRFGYSRLLDYPNVLNILLKKECLRMLKTIVLEFAGLEIDDYEAITSSKNGITPRLQKLQLNFCKINPSDVTLIARALSPNLCISAESNCKKHCFDLLSTTVQFIQ